MRCNCFCVASLFAVPISSSMLDFLWHSRAWPSNNSSHLRCTASGPIFAESASRNNANPSTRSPVLAFASSADAMDANSCATSHEAALVAISSRKLLANSWSSFRSTFAATSATARSTCCKSCWLTFVATASMHAPSAASLVSNSSRRSCITRSKFAALTFSSNAGRRSCRAAFPAISAVIWTSCCWRLPCSTFAAASTSANLAHTPSIAWPRSSAAIASNLPHARSTAWPSSSVLTLPLSAPCKSFELAFPAISAVI
mmetsp:Transcript_119108/g.344520  ORF Transcript_119108/g.344520 Transcript_119108/m.344520 type:complete len:258 (-) Transcript_119108:276-1049(-)